MKRQLFGIPAANEKGVGEDSKKTKQREQLILAMLQQPTLQKAAASVGISEATAWRIRKTPEFQREYLEARRKAFSQAMGRLQQAADAAVSTLIKIMNDTKQSAAIRGQTASRILDYSKEALVWEDFELRLHQLEQTKEQKEQLDPAA